MNSGSLIDIQEKDFFQAKFSTLLQINKQNIFCFLTGHRLTQNLETVKIIQFENKRQMKETINPPLFQLDSSTSSRNSNQPMFLFFLLTHGL